MKLYLIPGGGETVNDSGYKEILDSARRKKYKIEVLDMQLPNSNIQKLLDETTDKIKKDNPSKTIILGFSSGALFAHTLATRIPFHAGYYCSLATLFNDDIPPIGRIYERHFGKKTLQQMRKQKYGVSKAKYNYYFVGDSEGWKIPRRSKALAKIESGIFTVVPNTGHDLTRDYIKAIVKTL